MHVMMIGLLLLLAAVSVQATSDSWNVESGNWDTVDNWAGVNIPGSTTSDNTDVAAFSFTLTADAIVTVDATRYIGGISFGNSSAYKYSLNTGTLYLNSGGVIQTLSGNGNHTDTITSAIQISGASGATAFFTAGASSSSSLLRIGPVTGSATSGNTTTLTLNGSNSGANTVAGVIGDGSAGGTLAVVKDNILGSWTLSGANTYTGGTTVNAGTLNVSGNQSTATGGWRIGPLSYTNVTCSFQSGSIIVVPADKTLQVGNTVGSGLGYPTLNVAGVVTNNGLFLIGRGGTVTLNSGTKWLQTTNMSATAFGGRYAYLNVNSGTTFDYTGPSTIKLNPANVNFASAILTIKGVFTTQKGFESTEAATTTGAGKVVLSNGGQLLLNGLVTDLMTYPANKPMLMSLDNGGGLIDIWTNNTEISAVIGGTGTLTKRGTGMLTLSATNTYTGATTNESGTLRLKGGNNRLYTGGAFVFAATSTLDVDATSQTFSSLAVPSTGSVVTVKGTGGSLVISGSTSLEIGPGDNAMKAHKTTLDLSNLSNFTYDAPGVTFRLGLRTSTNGEYLDEIARVNMASTNLIKAYFLAMGDRGGNNDGGLSVLTLGQENTFKVNSINSGYSGRSDTRMAFGAGLTTPVITIRNTDGISPVANWLVGNIATFATAAQKTFTDIVDLSAGSVDALLATLNIGTADAASQASRVGTENASFMMGAGTLTASTINIGRMLSNVDGTVGGAYRANGTFTLDGGTVNATNLVMAINTITDTSSNSKIVSGTFNLSNGTLRAATVQLGAQTGTASPLVAFNWVKGTLGNVSGSDLIWTNMPVTLETAAAHLLDITGANTATFDANSIISGTGCPIVKTGSGTLKLCAANTYSGGTTISNGTLAAGCNNALAAGSDLTLSGGAFDPGSYAHNLDMLTLSDNTASQLLLSDPGCLLSFTGLAGTGTLTVTGTLGSTAVRFGMSDTALTGEQLSRITVNGFPAGLNKAGYLREVRGTMIRIM